MNRRCLVTGGFLVLYSLATPFPASAGEGVAGAANIINAQNTAATRNDGAVVGLSKDFRMFARAAAAYVYVNVVDVPWNQPQSTKPVLYVPIDMYAGRSAAQCKFPAVSGEVVPGVSGAINLFGTVTNMAAPSSVTPSLWSAALPDHYLPSVAWQPPFGGTDCAIGYLNEPAAKEYALVTYYVAPSGTRSVVNNLAITKQALAAQAAAALNADPPSNSLPLYYSVPSISGGSQ